MSTWEKTEIQKMKEKNFKEKRKGETFIKERKEKFSSNLEKKIMMRRVNFKGVKNER